MLRARDCAAASLFVSGALFAAVGCGSERSPGPPAEPRDTPVAPREQPPERAPSEDVLPSEGFEDALTSRSGCMDDVMYAWNEAGTVALIFRYPMAIPPGAERTLPITFPDPRASLSVVAGTQVVEELCTDVLTDETVIRQRWTAVRGTATLVLQASTSRPPNVRARLSLEDVVLEAPSEAQRPLTLDGYVLEVPGVSFRPG